MNTFRHTGRAGQRGVSLVELMVALTISLFILGGAASVFAKTRDLYRSNERSARLQEAARYAMSTIEADLRMANYWGLHSNPELVENAPGIDSDDPAEPDPSYSLPSGLSSYATTISSCGSMWAVKLFRYVEASNNAYGLDCAAFGTASGSSDQLTVRRASTDAITTGNLGATSGQLKLASSRARGMLFTGTALPSGFTAPLSEVRAVISNSYYVDQDSDLTAGLPSLRRKSLGFTGGAPTITDEEVVPGIEDLQVALGVDMNGDQNVDYFVDPDDGVPMGEAAVAVRVWLLVRSEQRDVGFTDDRTYTYADRSYTPNDSFRRLLVYKTIALRNTRR